MSLLRRLLPYTSIAVILALAYAGWTLLSRKRVDRISEQAAQAEKAKQDRKIVQAYGEGALKILTFYANPPTLKSGDKGLLCYGVANARVVRIEPQLEAVTPSLSRCVEVSPKVNTEYTLTAEDAAGKSDRRTVAISVR
ncbi:MAG: hypothetical protein M3Z32_14095 [Acidobacteriota bacterium]|nr:hypothetical protein [Acidobacteriota bacterium]